MAIIAPFPNTIANGQVEDATPVQANFDWIRSQVNANAAPVGPAASLEWTPLGQTPTFISTTSFSAPGNLTATLPIGRRLQTTNTAGTIYSTITNSVFTSLTTITVVNDSGVLDSGLSAVNYGILNAVNLSAPRWSYSAFHFIGSTNMTSNVGQLASSATGSFTVDVDALNELTPANGRFTARVAGNYQILFSAALTAGATYSAGLDKVDLIKNGGGGNQWWTLPFFCNPIGGTAANPPQAATYSPIATALAVGDFLTITCSANFSAGSVVWNATALIQRIS